MTRHFMDLDNEMCYSLKQGEILNITKYIKYILFCFYLFSFLSQMFYIFNKELRKSLFSIYALH